MLHTPTTETNETTQSKVSSPRESARALHPRTGAALQSNHSSNAARSLVADRQTPKQQAFAKAQSTYGNQAVLRMLNRSTSSSASVLQRKCACDGSGGDGVAGNEKKESALQRRAANQAEPNTGPPIVHEVLRSPGQPLDASTRAFMEPRFGHDFSQVRLHHDVRAAESANQINALAYTVGQNIVFGRNQYGGNDDHSRRLLAHELTHVLQQTEAHQVQRARLSIGPPMDSAEREADETAESIVTHSGHRFEPLAVRNKPMGIQRRVIVSPSSAVPTVLGHFDFICPSQFVQSGSEIVPAPEQCSTCSTVGCECLCDVATDTTRTYTINLLAASVQFSNETLFDGSTASVPHSTMHPNTLVQPNPIVNLADPASSVEVGWFTPTGTPNWRPHWRSMAHELCGHARLGQLQGGRRGCRPAHDSTIDTENTIAAEHGEPARGHFADPRQGETFQNPVGARGRVAFPQCNGLHFEAP